MNPQMMASGSIIGQQMRPGMSPGTHSMSMGMSMNPMGSVMAGSGMTSGPTMGAGMGGPMMTSGSMNSNAMGPGGMAAQMCSVGGGPVMEGMVDEGGRQMIISTDQFHQRMMWMQHQQQQHQMMRGHHPQQGPSPDYGHFPHNVQRPGAASYGGTGSGVPPPIQRLRMNFPNVAASGGGTSQMMPVYTGADGVRGLMQMPGGAGAVNQQQIMQQIQQRRTLQMPMQAQLSQQVRCQVSMPPTSMMDPGGMQQSAGLSASRAAVKRPPPPHYADTVLTHSGPRPVIGSAVGGGDPRHNQYTSSDLARMRFKHSGGSVDFPMVPITATDVVRYAHDASMRYGDSGGNM